MLLHGLDTTIWLWYHMAMNIWVVHFLVKEKKKIKAGLLVLYSTHSFCSSQSLGNYS